MTHTPGPLETKRTYWLSFADDSGFKGVVILHAANFELAFAESHLLGLNPGGEIQSIEVPMEIAQKISH